MQRTLKIVIVISRLIVMTRMMITNQLMMTIQMAISKTVMSIQKVKMRCH